jgi:hypothetical protein
MLVAMPTAMPSRAVDEQVRETGRQNFRFLFGAIVVVDEIDRVFIQIADHFDRKLIHSGFGVTHGGGFITIDRTEVAVAIDQGVTDRERLSQTNERQIQSGVAVRVVFAHDIADDTSGFLIRFARFDALFVHAEDNAALNRFQTIADIRDGRETMTDIE